MRRTKKAFEEVQLQVVCEALSGTNINELARKYELHPGTIRRWVREYRESVGDDEIPSTDEQLQELKRLQKVEEKYHTAVRVLGEKELEIEILRELLKKQNPAYPRIRNSKPVY